MSRKLKENKIIIKDKIAYIIPTNHNVEIMIDVDDLDIVKNYCWSVKNDGDGLIYARARERVTKRFVLMHRIICKEPKGKIIDHKNNDTLDNRKENLLICTHKENNNNKIVQANQYGKKVMKVKNERERLSSVD